MNLIAPISKVTRQFHPCPDCHALTPIYVITSITTEDDLYRFIDEQLNLAKCLSCGILIEAPVRVMVRVPDNPSLNHECIPIVLLQNRQVIEDLVHNSPADLRIVYSCAELIRSVEAITRIEMYHNNTSPEELDFSLDR